MKADRPVYTDHYRTLRVMPSASQEEIRRAYRLLAKRYHPDRVSPDRREWAREQMARINAAYEVLGDPQRRAEYDRQVGRQQGGPLVGVGGRGMAAWHLRRAREQARRRRLERRRATTAIGAAAVSSILVAMLLAAWLLPLLAPGGGSWLQQLVHLLGMDTPVGVWVWGIVMVAVWVMAWVAYKLTEL